jgi:hypothetical protein
MAPLAYRKRLGHFLAEETPAVCRPTFAGQGIVRTVFSKNGGTMSSAAVRLSELERLQPGEKEAKLRALVVATGQPPNGELRELDSRIHEYEQRAGLNSAALRDKLASGEVAETAEVCDWLMLLEIRERIAAVVSRPR